MTFSISNYKRDFELTECVGIPKDTVRFVDGAYFLYVSPSKASYIATSIIGAEFVELFREGIPLGIAFNEVTHRGRSVKEARSELAKVLVQIELQQFYESASPSASPDDEFPLQAYVTNRCNLQCKHCYVAAISVADTCADLSTDSWCRIVDEYTDFSNRHQFNKPKFTITGGEPLVRPDVFELARRAQVNGLIVELFTNGALLRTRETARTIKGCVDEVQLSLDGASASVHDLIRGSGTFDSVVRATHLLADAGVNFRVAITVMPQNYDDLFANLVQTLKSVIGSCSVRLGLGTAEGRATKAMQFADPISGQAAIRKLSTKLIVENVLPPDRIVPNRKQSSCGYCRSINIGNDGLVYPCAITKFPIGDLCKESFGTAAERCLNLASASLIDNVNGCMQCELRYVCGGTCRLNNLSRMNAPNRTYCDSEEKLQRIRRLVDRALNRQWASV